MKSSGVTIILAVVTALAGQPTLADDRPDNIRPWVPPADIRSRVLEGLQIREPPRAYEDRSAGRRLLPESYCWLKVKNVHNVNRQLRVQYR